jgi:hypothetical protein
VATHPTVRRYALMKRQSACIVRDYEIAAVWQAKQEAEPGTLLDATFPFQARLSEAGFTTKEDLEGADAFELLNYVALSQSEADAVLAAFAEL